MKTSKLILLSYAGILFLLITGFVAYEAMRDVQEKDGPFSTHTINLPAFSYIHTNQSFLIEEGEINEFLIKYPKEEAQPEIKYHISGDTLFIEELDNCKKLVLKITNNRQALGIKANKATIEFHGIKTDTLKLKGKADTKFKNFHKCKITHLFVTLDHSSFKAYKGKFENVECNLYKSEFYSHKKIATITGTGKHDSKLNLRLSKKINLTLDKSSHLDCY